MKNVTNWKKEYDVPKTKFNKHGHIYIKQTTPKIQHGYISSACGRRPKEYWVSKSLKGTSWYGPFASFSDAKTFGTKGYLIKVNFNK